MTGRIERTRGINPAFEIQVDGYPFIRFMFCGKAAAVSAYRERFGLKGKRINWIDYTKPGEPQNLYEAVMQALQFK